jgi:hypothetical protein
VDAVLSLLSVGLETKDHEVAKVTPAIFENGLVVSQSDLIHETGYCIDQIQTNKWTWSNPRRDLILSSYAIDETLEIPTVLFYSWS